MKPYDIVIIGAGILGLATGMTLLKRSPHLKVAILEKEERIATQQTGHNSGVIHSGIYYKPGSLKAKNCILGIKLLKDFCDKHKIPYKVSGKLIIATDPSELPRLDELEKRGRANGVQDLKRIHADEIKEIEPHAAGIAALYSPHTAIIDFSDVANQYAKEFIAAGGDIFLNAEVLSVSEKGKELIILSKQGDFLASKLLNCAGVFADNLAKLMGNHLSNQRIIPFRGEYYELVPEKRDLVKGLIYPVPDPNFPFLGVHLSRTITDSVEAGPNAVLALSKMGYRKRDINLIDCWSFLNYKGFWHMARRYWRQGFHEFHRSYSKKAFLEALQRLVPELQMNDLRPAEAGVRSQVVLPDGTLHDDFLIVENQKAIHVLNAPSPAATSSLSIANHLTDLLMTNPLEF